MYPVDYFQGGVEPHAQPPTWRTRSPYLYPLESLTLIEENSSVSLVTRLRLAKRVRAMADAGSIFFAAASRPAVGPTQPLIQWVPETLYL
jgi:hypothetical protein